MANTIQVLYVEDDKADADFAQTALKEVGCDHVSLKILEDGEEAIKYASEEREGGKTVFPQLILLDLNLPKVNGKEVLQNLKSSTRWKHIPVVILTTSSVRTDVEEAYDLGASGFITKPDNFNRYKQLFEWICNYWVKACTLPSHGHGCRS